MKLNFSGALLMRGVRLLKGDETERKTEGVAKQDGGIFFGKLSGS